MIYYMIDLYCIPDRKGRPCDTSQHEEDCITDSKDRPCDGSQHEEECIPDNKGGPCDSSQHEEDCHAHQDVGHLARGPCFARGYLGNVFREGAEVAHDAALWNDACKDTHNT